jgi:hypothetical protein
MLTIRVFNGLTCIIHCVVHISQSFTENNTPQALQYSRSIHLALCICPFLFSQKPHYPAERLDHPIVDYIIVTERSHKGCPFSVKKGADRRSQASCLSTCSCNLSDE